MTVEYELSRSDLIAFAERQKGLVPRSVSNLYYYGALPILFVLLAVLTQSLAAAAIASVVMVVFNLAMQHWVERQYQHAIYPDENISVFLLPQRATLGVDGLTVSSEVATQLYRWQFIKHVNRSSNYVSFVLTPLEQINIPVCAFRGEDHIRQFVAEADRYVKDHAASPQIPKQPQE
jgi:hypothetical protein